ncbi:4-hydroxy-tetrahydrodipicolinate synthase [Alkalimonas collagenimarina]|uniref:4-hydroxy-tetrahydrodipicolinate synthase n=1 Tax=Alkalimonas collagenimarina TaxID=400390 RepID=A0ABT9H0B0_9GAMM|nr:4-hydroxy-tetrahydrodipicolinate synthase [Alkalimonas collagenimarina]MDP4536713.1 4-hydroxy-tetrahydrodipicolinate synthase [Alkalimonas collagenimarina]
MLKGSYVALITPMLANGDVDYQSLTRLVDYHLAEGTDGLVVLGTTAEAATLEWVEQIAVVQAVCDQVAGKITIIVGNGANSTALAVEKTKQLTELPIDGFLTVTPYYNKPMQKGMRLHFEAIAAVTDKPILLYNVPGRTGVDLLPETVAELAVSPNIVGIKDATGSLERLHELQQCCPAGFSLFSGDDISSADFMLAGGHGVISVTANVAAGAVAGMVRAALADDETGCRQYDQQLQPLHHQLFVEANPIPVKWAAARTGLIQSDFVRLPLTTLEPIHQTGIEEALRHAKIEF